MFYFTCNHGQTENDRYIFRQVFFSKHAFSAVSAPNFSKLCHATYMFVGNRKRPLNLVKCPLEEIRGQKTNFRDFSDTAARFWNQCYTDLHSQGVSNLLGARRSVIRENVGF